MKFNKAQFIWGPDLINDRILFDLDDISPSTPYVVKGISGLEPPENVLSIRDRVFEGGTYQGRRPQNREIVVLLRLQPNYSAGEDPGILRKRLYPMLSPKLNGVVRFRLLDDLELNWVETTGYIKRIEANPYMKDVEVQITMSCLSAYFSEPEYVYPTPAALSGQAQFTMNNPGDVPVGFYYSQFMTAATASVVLTGNTPTQFVRLTYPFLVGDRVVIETIPGRRRVVRVRASVANVNLLPMMSIDSTWLMLDPGINTFTPGNTTFTGDIFRYTPMHWGF